MLKNLHEYASKFWTDRSKAIMVCILLSFYSFFYHKFPVIKTTLVILVNITIGLPGSHLADLTAFKIYKKSGLLLLLLLLLLLFVGIFWKKTWATIRPQIISIKTFLKIPKSYGRDVIVINVPGYGKHPIVHQFILKFIC